MNLRHFALVALPAVTFLHAQDTQAARMKQAERYVQNLPAKDFLAPMVKALKDGESQERQAFITMAFLSFFDYAAMDRAAKEALVNGFSTEEIRALADLCATPSGRAAMKKLNHFTGPFGEALQAEVKTAFEKAAKERGEHG
jgi:predicted NAD/FAD-binding protein